MEVGRALERVCADLNLGIEQARAEGYRLDLIFPADDPHDAMLSGPGGSLHLTTRPDAPRPSGNLPQFRPEFVLTRAAGESGAGRAGMLYRDLIPSRLGGRYIASHITIPDGGPVADWVHYHRIAFQMIAVRSGWARVVYEDQGESFVMRAGDVVLQPPGIRHRVLETSAAFEVIEVGAPALHETLADHDMALPNDRVDHPRLFDGQRFLWHRGDETPWTPYGDAEAQETEMLDSTGGRADVRIVRGPAVEFAPHAGELVFGFVLAGTAQLQRGAPVAIGPADAFVIPPGEPWSIAAGSADFRLFHLTIAALGQFA